MLSTIAGSNCLTCSAKAEANTPPATAQARGRSLQARKKEKRMLLSFKEYFNELGFRNEELIIKYRFQKFDFDPEFIYESKDLKWFVDTLVKTLYPKDKYEFIKDCTSKDGKYFIVNFKFCGKELKIYTNSDNDFIGGNYPIVLQKMNKLSTSKTISTYVNMAGPLISGEEKELENARKEGLAISLNNESIFWYLNSNNEKINKKDEHYIKVKVLDENIDDDKLPLYFKNGCSILKGDRLTSYSDNQIRLIKKEFTYSIFVDGNAVSSDNNLNSMKEMDFDFKVAGKILAYGFLKTKQEESVEIQIENVVSKKSIAISKMNLLKQIEEYVK